MHWAPSRARTSCWYGRPSTYYITGYDLQQHFPDDTVLVERYRPEQVYAVCYFDREQNYYYLKRFPIESSDKTQFFLDEEERAISSAARDVPERSWK